MRTAVLAMAYGSPRTLDEVRDYFTDIRGGRPPSDEAAHELTERYRRIGGPSGLNEITQAQAQGLASELELRAPGRYEVHVGMKHWHPYIAEAVGAIAASGIEKIIGLVLAPHYSSKSIGEYRQRVEDAIGDTGLELEMVESWYDTPSFVNFVASNIRETLQGWDPDDGATRVFFTAHSIPERIIASGDPYAEQLAHSAKLFAEAAGIGDFQTGWQSASNTPEPWIGPDILDILEDFAGSGGRRAVIAPVGFVCDHLEVLFDVDVECVEKAAELGIELRRIASPNAHPSFVAALADVVQAADS